MEEVWKDIIGYEGLYKINNKGIVISLRRNKVMSQMKQGDYLCVGLNFKGKQIRLLLHRLLAIHFIPNPENKPMVNHKDGNKNNNNLSNLEWVTGTENNFHAFENGLYKNEKSHKWYINKIFTNGKNKPFKVLKYLGHEPYAFYLCEFENSKNQYIASITDIKRYKVGDLYKKVIINNTNIEYFNNVKEASKIYKISDRSIHDSILFNKPTKNYIFSIPNNVDIHFAYTHNLLKERDKEIYIKYIGGIN